ncbi:MAG: hypothetical protein K2X47_09470 [Bdellovibrionales bacterium]|nr:hypothetical protein [Bdellovibrionales bacterium]
MKAFFGGTFVLILLFSPFISFAEDAVNVQEACKQDCPDAKDNPEAHKCAENKGRLNKAFRKSKCWEVNEKYEASLANKAK